MCKHSLYVDKFNRLFYLLLIQLVRAANNSRWWLKSDLCSSALPELYPQMELSTVNVNYSGNAYGIKLIIDTYS